MEAEREAQAESTSLLLTQADPSDAPPPSQPHPEIQAAPVAAESTEVQAAGPDARVDADSNEEA